MILFVTISLSLHIWTILWEDIWWDFCITNIRIIFYTAENYATK